jgi:hypothetical protein
MEAALRLDAIILADHAAAAEGKLYIHGGGITRINVPFVPFAVPMLAIVLRYMIETPEDRAPHTVEMQFQTPGGVHLFPDGSAHVAAIPKPTSPQFAEGEEQYFQAVLAVGSVPIIETGLHTFSVLWDGEVVREFAIPVVLMEPDASAASPPNRAERRRQERAGDQSNP